MPLSAQGILEYKRKRQRMQIDSDMQGFLDRFYMSRIGIRMLIGQHIALNDTRSHGDSNYVGIICTKTNVKDLASEAIENARFTCEDHFGLFDAPKVQLVCRPDLNFMYVPGHLSHMLFETLKNSLRAVVDRHGADQGEYPVTKVIVAEGKRTLPSRFPMKAAASREVLSRSYGRTCTPQWIRRPISTRNSTRATSRRQWLALGMVCPSVGYTRATLAAT